MQIRGRCIARLTLGADAGHAVIIAGHRAIGNDPDPPGKRGKFDITSELAVQTSGGRVVALSAFRITSD